MSSNFSIPPTVPIAHVNYSNAKKLFSAENIKTMRVALTIFLKIILASAAIAVISSFAFSYLSPLVLGYSLSTKSIVKFGVFVYLSASTIAALTIAVQKVIVYFRKKKLVLITQQITPPRSPIAITKNLSIAIPSPTRSLPFIVSITPPSPPAHTPALKIQESQIPVVTRTASPPKSSPTHSPLQSPSSQFQMVSGNDSPTQSPRTNKTHESAALHEL